MKARLSAQLRNHDKKIKFLVVGAWNTAFGYLSFYFFEGIFAKVRFLGGYSYLPAILLSNAVSLLMAYSMHRAITFKSNASGRAMLYEFLRFAMANMFTVGLSVVLLPFFVEIAGIGPKLSGFLVIVVAALANYLAHSRITFARGSV